MRKYKRKAGVIYTNPHTGESGDRSYWCKKLNITSRTFNHRLNTYEPDDPRMYTPRQTAYWTEDEDVLLSQIYDYPKLVKHWNREARKNGWHIRSPRALVSRVAYLKRVGLITDFADDYTYITRNQLAVNLSISPTAVDTFIRHGMPTVKNNGEGSYTKVKIIEFVFWALGDGRKLVAKAIASNPIGAYWLLTQISIWRQNIETIKSK